MDEQDFKEDTLSSAQVFDGKLLKVFSDQVRLPDGYESVREYVKHPGAVVVDIGCPARRCMSFVVACPSAVVNGEETITTC